jgi:hypothetical protein
MTLMTRIRADLIKAFLAISTQPSAFLAES